jgi:hypothetical protein
MRASVRADQDGKRPQAANRHRSGTYRDEGVTELTGGEQREAAMNDPTPARAAPADGRSAGGAMHSRSATMALGLGVCGVGLGFLLMFAVLTPAAIVYGIRGLREIRAEPTLRGRGRAWTGIGLAAVAPFLWVGLFVALLSEGVL